MKTGIAEDDLEDAPRRRVTLKYGMQIFSQGFEHSLAASLSFGNHPR
jgi:hypothetical protein